MGGELGHGVQGGSGGLYPRFTSARCTRGVRGALPPVYKCTAHKGGPGLAPGLVG